jgi:hypothetical protein
MVGGIIEFPGVEPPAEQELFTVISLFLPDGSTLTVKADTMAYTLQVGKGINVKLSFVDVAGNAATVQTTSWASSNEANATVTQSPDDQSAAKIASVGPLGTAQIVATSDVDLGEGVKNKATTFDLTLVAGEAMLGTIDVVGDPFDLEAPDQGLPPSGTDPAPTPQPAPTA